MVPFGPMGFMKGEIVHGNEILVLLGENYFVKRTCAQAKEIIDRRQSCNFLLFVFISLNWEIKI